MTAKPMSAARTRRSSGWTRTATSGSSSRGKASDEFIAHGEEAAYKIGRLIDPDAIEVRTIRLNGRTGSIQKWRRPVSPRNTTSQLSTSPNSQRDEIAQVQREHVIDWLISNHDGHSKQFLRAKDGKVYGIDKGQLFKFLGEDKLSIDYHPNGVCGESEPFYNTLFRAAKQGKVAVDPSVTLRYIREVERISDDDYLALIRPYVGGQVRQQRGKEKGVSTNWRLRASTACARTSRGSTPMS